MNDVAPESEEDQTFLPVTQTINPLSDVPTTDHKALVIRLELNSYDYARLEDLVRAGVDQLSDRYNALSKLGEDVKAGRVKLTEPLIFEDIEAAKQRHGQIVLAAKAIQNTIKRPLTMSSR